MAFAAMKGGKGAENALQKKIDTCSMEEGSSRKKGEKMCTHAILALTEDKLRTLSPPNGIMAKTGKQVQYVFGNLRSMKFDQKLKNLSCIN